MTEWFEQWFGEEYLQLYPHRDGEDAQRVVALIAGVVTLPRAQVLDLACGPGRHAKHLAAHGATVTGFDLSMPLLSRAKHRSSGVGRWVRGDMRYLPFCGEIFDVVVNLFTSFGYFAEDREHLAVIRDVARTLTPGGMLVIDYLNADFVRSNLVDKEEMVVGSRRVAIERRLTDGGRFVVKEMHLADDGRSFLERVRLFSQHDLAQMMEDADLTVTARFGSYDGDPVSTDSPRTILMAERR